MMKRNRALVGYQQLNASVVGVFRRQAFSEVRVLERLVYVSTAALRRDLEVQASRIAAEVEARNFADGVAGALLGHDGHFVQALEGERPALDRLLKRLEADPRHYDLVLVDRWRVDEPLFDGWGMGAVAMDAALRSDLDALIGNPTLNPRPMVETMRSRAIPPTSMLREAGPEERGRVGRSL